VTDADANNIVDCWVGRFVDEDVRVLITTYEDGSVTAALKHGHQNSWGLPIDLVLGA
jgi:hypothetical protein